MSIDKRSSNSLSANSINPEPLNTNSPLVSNQKKYFTPLTAIAVVIANMVGTGVFTSLGYQLITIQSGFPLILLWIVGGLIALCGALCYGELGAALPRSGGEYSFLTRIYGPAAGFVSGWISAVIGFAAPIALAAITFGAYIQSAFADTLPLAASKGLAIGLILILTLIHMGNRSSSSRFQAFMTILKIVVILCFCVGVLAVVNDYQPVSLLPKAGDHKIIFGSAFAVSLIYVSYAYTGWNAASYLSGELENPQKTLPLILIIATIIVAVLYVCLNASFLLVTPIADMQGELEIGVIAAKSVFGPRGAQITGLVLGILLISTVSAMSIAGPRVLQVMGEDYKAFQWLAQKNVQAIPARAIIAQSGLALCFVVTSTFESVLIFAGFILALNSFMTVIGLLVLRYKEPALARPFRLPLYPLPAFIYLALTGGIMLFVAITNPIEVIISIGVIIMGGIVYQFTK